MVQSYRVMSHIVPLPLQIWRYLWDKTAIDEIYHSTGTPFQFLQPDTAAVDISSSLKLEPARPPNPRQLAGLVCVPPPPLCCIPVCKASHVGPFVAVAVFLYTSLKTAFCHDCTWVIGSHSVVTMSNPRTQSEKPWSSTQQTKKYIFLKT